MGHSETDIEAALLKIYRTLLGVEAKTATDGLRHELGIASQKVRAEAAALKFRHNILSLDPQDFLVRRVYDGLRGEGGYGLSPASIFGRSNVDNAQRYVSLLWPRFRDDFAYYI